MAKDFRLFDEAVKFSMDSYLINNICLRIMNQSIYLFISDLLETDLPVISAIDALDLLLVKGLTMELFRDN